MKKFGDNELKFNGEKKIIIQPIFKEIKNNFTYEFWIKPEETHKINKESVKGASGISGQRYVIGPGHAGHNDYAGTGVSVGTNGVSVYEHTAFHLPSTLVYNTNITKWTHIAIVYNEKVPFLYINGELKKRGWKSSKDNVYASGIIGGLESFGCFVGEIKEVRIWDHARTQRQIKNNMYKDEFLNEQGLFKNWKLNDGNELLVLDKITSNFYEEVISTKRDQHFPIKIVDNNVNDTHKRNLTIIFVGHEAEKSGAPILFLDIIKWFKKYTEYKVKVILLRGGQIQEEYQKNAETLILRQKGNFKMYKQKVVEFIGSEECIIFLNTVVAARFVELIDLSKYPIIAYIHELEKTLRLFTKETKLLKSNVRSLIADSDAVANNLINNHGYSKNEIETVYAFIDPQHKYFDEEKRKKIRQNLNLPLDKIIIYSCGTAYWRKNPQGFVEIAERVLYKTKKECEFIWIGNGEEKVFCERLIKEKNLKEHVKFIGCVGNTRDYFATGDIFLLPSLEDPFPLVCLEAAECGLPVICYDGVGGMPDFVENDAGFVIPFNDINAMAEATFKLVENKPLRENLGKNAREKVLQRHALNKSVQLIKKIIDMKLGFK